MENKMKVFLDTMIYLHYKSLDQIDLAGFLSSASVVVIVPRITLRELDEQKNTHKSGRIQERARKALQKLKQWMAGKEIRPGISAEFLPGVPKVDYSRLGLKPEWGDDVLIATIVQYRTDNPDESVVLVTQDSAAQMTASHLGITVLEFPAEHKLPSELDPLEAENRDLLKQVAVLQSRVPKLTVSFAGPKEVEQHAKFIIQSPLAITDEQVASKVNEVRLKLGKRQSRASDTELIALRAQLLMQASGEGISPQEYERYDREIETYLANYEAYTREMCEVRNVKRQSIKFAVEIRNDGAAPADDVDVLLHLPDGFHLFSEDDIPALPVEPVPPCKPRTTREKLAAVLHRTTLGVSPFRMPDVKLPSSFEIERTESYNVRDHFARIKHGDRVTMPKMVLIFESYESAASFSCTYIVRAANLPVAVSGELHFVVKKADG